MSRPVLIVPGLNGSAPGHWQRHWLDDDRDAVLVEQADWSDPQPGRWLHRLEKAVIANPGALIVAHSLGSILAARLATSSVAPLVAGALLVAPADIERTSELRYMSVNGATRAHPRPCSLSHQHRPLSSVQSHCIVQHAWDAAIHHEQEPATAAEVGEQVALIEYVQLYHRCEGAANIAPH